MKKVLNIDWLALWCESTEATNWDNTNLKKLDYGTRIFANVAKYQRDGLELASIAYKPNSSVLNSRGCLVKFANWLLYSAERDRYIKEVLIALKLEVKSISRLDIACDFEGFANGRDPRNFIADFLNCKYLHNGRGKFQVMGEQKWASVFDYLKLGSRKSPECVYLYDKTKELQQVKDKPYIREVWRANGLNDSKTIWRLEISITADATSELDTTSGEIIKLGLNDVLDNSTLLKIYEEKYKRLFCFKINDSTKNKSRMKDLELLDFENFGFERYRGEANKETTRREKMLLKSLHKYVERYGIDSLTQGYNIADIKDRLIRVAGMGEYYEKKKDLWNEQE